MLISTECGGEGRNFEFCTRLVLFDLPWNPMVVEQRIGRLDRIGRTHPGGDRLLRVRPSGLGCGGRADCTNRWGCSANRSEGSRARAVARRAGDRDELALEAESLTPTRTNGSRTSSSEARDRPGADPERRRYHELHREPVRGGDLAEAILARVPAGAGGVDRGGRAQPRRAARNLTSSPQRGEALASRWRSALTRTCRGPARRRSGLRRSSAAFDREEAVQDESIDFYASGHPLVEGLLAHLEESDDRPCRPVAHASTRWTLAGLGLCRALQATGPLFRAIVVDADGNR